MEDLVTLRGCPVFVTGHTGFKGGWLSLWLERLGARVHGYALAPPTKPSLFESADVARALASDTRADLADRSALAAALARSGARVVFHLAAQPLVRDGYRDPIGTFETNVMGTAHVLDAVRATPSVEAVVVVATDKVYENRESGHAYTECDALGGHDPYSASKAAAEIVVASYRKSFFGAGGHAARVASARAGNVLGGGDWAAERLVPDCLRAFAAGEPVRLRYPNAVRPWQHVLEPLAGYLALAARLLGADGADYARGWNFGPDAADDARVVEVAEATARSWGDGARVIAEPDTRLHEAGLLHLDSRAARDALGWRPRWPLERALDATVAWQRAWLRGDDLRAVTLDQIAAYEADA